MQPESARSSWDFGLMIGVKNLLAAERRGDLAALRRMDPDRPAAAAFFRILVKVIPDAGNELTRKAAHFVRILALRPELLNTSDAGETPPSLGKSLVGVVSEARVQRLLAARDATLHDQLRLVSRQLTKAGLMPWRDIASLLLDGQDKAEARRLRIAKDYWRALDAMPSNKS